MEIDFIITWVDGNNPTWVEEFNKYCPQDKRIIDTRNERYRDSGLLKYWFRGVEKFAPWVRKVHFVTCGQKPKWLNLNASKLHCVSHADYIPEKYLPVFSSHPIELMMHKIPDLTECFVYFNDDFFLTSPVEKNFFFKNNIPRDSAILNVVVPQKEQINRIQFNNVVCINRTFHNKTVIKHNFFKWINFKYGVDILRTLFLVNSSYFTGFWDQHFAIPYTKTEILEGWNKYSAELYRTMGNRFRCDTDVNHWLFRYLRLCNGHFCPQNPMKYKKYFSLSDNPKTIKKAILSGRYKEVIINDADIPDSENVIKTIVDSFETILPEKSSFEL